MEAAIEDVAWVLPTVVHVDNSLGCEVKMWNKAMDEIVEDECVTAVGILGYGLHHERHIGVDGLVVSVLQECPFILLGRRDIAFGRAALGVDALQFVSQLMGNGVTEVFQNGGGVAVGSNVGTTDKSHDCWYTEVVMEQARGVLFDYLGIKGLVVVVGKWLEASEFAKVHVRITVEEFDEEVEAGIGDGEVGPGGGAKEIAS